MPLCFFLSLMIGLFFPMLGKSQLSDIYASASLKTYQWVNGDCQNLEMSDLLASNRCSHLGAADFKEDAASIAESFFFNAQANQEVERLGCSIKKAQAVQKSPEMQKHLVEDLTTKVKAGKEIRKLLLPKQKELMELKDKTNRLRPQGLQTEPGELYLSLMKAQVALEKEVRDLESSLAALIVSSWNGGSESMSSFLMDQIRSGKNDPDEIRKKIERGLPNTLQRVGAEFKENKKVLLEQRTNNDANCQSCWELTNETKRELFLRAKEDNAIATMFSASPQVVPSVECRLEGKYGKGQDYLENTILVGTLVGTGGAGLLAKAPLVLRTTLAAGTKAGRISQQASKVLLYSTFSVTSADVIRQIDKECLPAQPSRLIANNTCSGSDAELVSAQMTELAEGNCVLAVVLSGLPLPALAGVKKALEHMSLNPRKTKNSLEKRGDELFQKTKLQQEKPVTISADEIIKRESETRDFAEKNGIKIAKARTLKQRNPDLAKLQSRIDKNNEAIAAIQRGEPDLRLKQRQDKEEQNLKRAKKVLDVARNKLEEAQIKLKEKLAEIEMRKIDLEKKTKELQLASEAKIADLKFKSASKIADLKEKRALEVQKGRSPKLYDEQIAREQAGLERRIQEESGRLEASIKRLEAMETQKFLSDIKQAEKTVQSAQQALEEYQDAVKKQNDVVATLAADRIKEIQAETANLQQEMADAPEIVDHTNSELSNLRVMFFRKILKIQGSENANLSSHFSLYEVTELPKKKGPRHYETPALLHPDMEKDMQRLKELGVQLRLDPTMDLDGTLGFFLAHNNNQHVQNQLYNSPDLVFKHILNIKYDSPYHVFKHELQHAEFNHLIKPKLDEARDVVKRGESIRSLFTPTEIAQFGEAKIKRLEELLKRRNTELAINETMAVDAQLEQMGMRRLSTPTMTKNEVYAILHQINGYQELMDKGPLTPLQKQEYQKALRSYALAESYVKGTEAAQKAAKAFVDPTQQSLVALSNRLQELLSADIEERPLIYDKEGRVFFQTQDGKWERIRLESN